MSLMQLLNDYILLLFLWFCTRRCVILLVVVDFNGGGFTVEIVFVTNLLISIAAGIIVGLERQWQQKLAGIRTTALVSFGSCMFVTLSTFIAGADSSPTRIAAQVVSGIGFLAGGVIIRDGFSVSGINTAATLWCSAAIGSMIGAVIQCKALLQLLC